MSSREMAVALTQVLGRARDWGRDEDGGHLWGHLLGSRPVSCDEGAGRAGLRGPDTRLAV